jgi:hypothetical protein
MDGQEGVGLEGMPGRMQAALQNRPRRAELRLPERRLPTRQGQGDGIPADGEPGEAERRGAFRPEAAVIREGEAGARLEARVVGVAFLEGRVEGREGEGAAVAIGKVSRVPAAEVDGLPEFRQQPVAGRPSAG